MADTNEVQVEVAGEQWTDPAVKAKCLRWYVQANESHMAEYTKIIQECNHETTTNKNVKIQSHYAATKVLMETQRDAHKDQAKLDTWYQEDQESFGACDTSTDGLLDKGEFKAKLKEWLKASDDDAKKIFSEWDIDKSKGVGPSEYCAMMAVYRAQLFFLNEKTKNEVMLAALNELIPGGAGMAFFCAYYGPVCSLCTLCTSWLCVGCYAKNTMEKAQDPKYIEEAAKRVEKAAEEAVKKAQQESVTLLKKGPAKSMMKKITDAAATETTGLLAPGEQ